MMGRLRSRSLLHFHKESLTRDVGHCKITMSGQFISEKKTLEIHIERIESLAQRRLPVKHECFLQVHLIPNKSSLVFETLTTNSTYKKHRHHFVFNRDFEFNNIMKDELELYKIRIIFYEYKNGKNMRRSVLDIELQEFVSENRVKFIKVMPD